MTVLLVYYFFIFIAGTLIGSFLNLVADRVVKGKNILVDRSECDFCHTKLGVKDLFPIFSFLFQKGRCRYCDKKLSWYYPLSEIITGLMFVFVAHYTQILGSFNIYVLLSFIYVTVVFCFFIVLFLTDAKYMVIPNKIVYAGIAFILVFLVSNFSYAMYQFRQSLITDDFGKYLYESGYWHENLYAGLRSLGVMLLSTFFIALFFKFLIWVTKGRGMGEGDLPLAVLISVFNGYPFNILAIFMGFVVGAIFSLVLVALRRKSMKSTIPFGPFLILGSLIVFVWGEFLFEWYFSLF